MITDGKKRHYLSVKKLPASLIGVTSEHVRDFYCLNCFHHGENSTKVLFIIYADLWFSTDDGDKKYHKVRDHCHYIGIYRGAAHSVIYHRYKSSKNIPIYFIMVLHMIIILYSKN